MRTLLTVFSLDFAILVLATASSYAAWQPVGSEFRVNTTINGNGSHPAVAYGDGGMSIVVWSNFLGGLGLDSPIYFQRFAADGTPIGGEVQVRTGIHPEVAARPGVPFFVITWEEVISGGRRTVAARFDNVTGALLGSYIFPDGSGSHEADPAVALNSTGEFYLTWENTAVSDIFIRRYSSSGVALAATITVNTFGNPMHTPVIKYLSDGRFAVAWQLVSSLTGIPRLRWYDAAGTALTPETGAFGAAESDNHPQISPTADGGFVLTYGGRNTLSQLGVYAQVYDSNFNRILAETQLDAANGSTNDAPDVEVNPDGSFTAVWLAHQSSATFGDAIRRDFSITGAASGSEATVNTTTLGARSEVVIAEDHAHSRMLAVWDGQGNGDADGIYGQYFELVTPVPTLFSRVHATSTTSGVELAWSVQTNGMLRGFSITRKHVGTEEVIVLTPDLLAASAYQFVDSKITDSGEYEYQVFAVEEDGSQYSSAPVRVRVEGPSLTLFANEPNPFNPSTHIRYEIPASGSVRLDVFDITGRRVARLFEGVRPAGRHDVEWNGKDDNGATVGSGVYVYRLKAGKQSISRKMVLLK